MPSSAWKAMFPVVLLFTSAATMAMAGESAFHSAPVSLAPAAVKVSAHRPAACAPVSCEQVWREWLGLESIFEDSFDLSGVCSETWSDWLGACSANQACSGGSCACIPDHSDCNILAEDGCECASPFCCAGSCATEHSNGLGQSYFDCGPLGTPGSPATYSLVMATAARAAWVPGNDNASTCGGPSNQALSRTTVSECAVWVYTGSFAGYVHLGGITCDCPAAGDTTWN